MILLKEECGIGLNNVIAYISISKEFTIKFDFYSTSQSSQRSNVLHLIASDDTRLLGVWMETIGSQQQLYICRYVNGISQCVGQLKITSGVWSNVVITQTKGKTVWYASSINE